MSATQSPVETIAIVGVGLIGGSIALAAKQAGIKQVIGIGRNQDRLQAAVQAGVIDVGATSSEAISAANLIIVCTPVDRIVEDVRGLWSHCSPGAIVTDAGSVKSRICRELADLNNSTSTDEKNHSPLFIGSHPLAGSHESGFENATADLFRGRLCVVTPLAATPKGGLTRVTDFWKSIGMRVEAMTPEEHDQILARTSHLPHATAAALASLLTDQVIPFTATGFRDTTRIAAGEPNVWTPIFRENAGPLVAEIDGLIAQLEKLRDCLKDSVDVELHRYLQRAKDLREQL